MSAGEPAWAHLRRDTLLLLGASVIMAALAFCNSVFLGRLAGQSLLGQYAFLTALLSVLNEWVEFGGSALLVRELTQRPTCAGPLLRGALQLKVGLAALAGVALLLLPLRMDIPAGALALMAVTAWGWSAAATLEAGLRARRQMGRVALSQVVGMALHAAGCIVLATKGAGILGLAAWMALARLFQPALTGALYGRPAAGADAADRAAGRWPALLRRGAPFALAALAGACFLRLDMLLMAWLRGGADAGLYAAARSLIGAFHLIPNAVSGALYPHLAQHAMAQTPAERRSQARRLVGLAALLGASLALAAGGLAEPLLRLTYGADYLPALTLLRVGALSLLPLTLNGLALLLLYAWGRQREVSRALILGALLKLALGAWWIGRLGSAGAAWGLVAGEIALCALYLPLWIELTRH
jgi:O-antigen/teichoic acid export membrane protein